MYTIWFFFYFKNLNTLITILITMYILILNYLLFYMISKIFNKILYIVHNINVSYKVCSNNIKWHYYYYFVIPQLDFMFTEWTRKIYFIFYNKFIAEFFFSNIS